MFHPPDKEGWIFHLSNSVIVWESVITYVTEERARGRGIEEELRTESALWGWFSSWFQCEYDQKNRYHCLLSCGKRFVSLSPRAPLSLKSLTLLSRRICTFIKLNVCFIHLLYWSVVQLNLSILTLMYYCSSSCLLQHIQSCMSLDPFSSASVQCGGGSGAYHSC